MIVLSEEQIMLQDMARNWVDSRAPVSALRALRENPEWHGFDPELYAEMVEMGWPGVLVPEAAGGVGMGFVSLGLIVEELGRNLVASPLVATAAGAVSAVLLGDSDLKDTYFANIVSGTERAALAIDSGNHHARSIRGTTARTDADGWILNGTKRAVPDASGATLLIVAARIDDAEPALFACPANAAGVSATPLDRIDSRSAADIGLENVRLPASALLGRGQAYLDAVFDRVCAVLAAEMLGGARQSFDTTLEYLKTRVQFGHPIGSFQALQHRMADLYAEIALVRAAVYDTLQSIDAGEGAPDKGTPGEKASLAKAMAGDCFRTMAREMIQLHGGIGMTDEHDAGLYLKRAHVLDHTLGNAAFHRARYASLLGI